VTAISQIAAGLALSNRNYGLYGLNVNMFVVGGAALVLLMISLGVEHLALRRPSLGGDLKLLSTIFFAQEPAPPDGFDAGAVASSVGTVLLAGYLIIFHWSVAVRRNRMLPGFIIAAIAAGFAMAWAQLHDITYTRSNSSYIHEEHSWLHEYAVWSVGWSLLSPSVAILIYVIVMCVASTEGSGAFWTTACLTYCGIFCADRLFAAANYSQPSYLLDGVGYGILAIAVAISARIARSKPSTA
jgi:hypothetical protein